MYSKLGTLIAIVMAIFPFAAVVASLAQSELAFTAIVVTAIVAVFFVMLLIASRITIEPETEPARHAARAGRRRSSGAGMASTASRARQRRG